MTDLRLYACFTSDGQPATGLTLSDIQFTVNRVKQSDNSITTPVSAASATAEIGGGYYLYVLSSVDFNTYDYLWFAEYIGTAKIDNVFCVAGTNSASV